ncbi:hypothetical protein PO909_029455 [Leuciscus waleckii]
MVWYGSVQYGSLMTHFHCMVRYGSFQYGSLMTHFHCMVRYGSVQYGSLMTHFHCMVRYGSVQYGSLMTHFHCMWKSNRAKANRTVPYRAESYHAVEKRSEPNRSAPSRTVPSRTMQWKSAISLTAIDMERAMTVRKVLIRLKNNQTPAKDPSEDQTDPAVLLALKQQETSMRDMMKQVVKETVQEVLSGEFKQMKEMFETSISAIEQLSKDVKAQAEVSDTLKMQQNAMDVSLRAVKKNIAEHGGEISQLRERIVSQEDRARRLNLRLVNLPEGAEGSDPIGFLQENLSKWFPALTGPKVEIQRAHRIYGPRSGGRPRTLIFCLLRYGDRVKILREARALKSPPSHARSNLYFFADYSPETTSRRKAFDAIKKQLYAKGYHPFLGLSCRLEG